MTIYEPRTNGNHLQAVLAGSTCSCSASYRMSGRGHRYNLRLDKGRTAQAN